MESATELNDFDLFVAGYLQGFDWKQCQFDGMTVLDGILGLSVYKLAPYHVQLFLCEPGKEIPNHAHPNVDTYLVYLSGEGIIKTEKGCYAFNEHSTKKEGMSPGSALHIRAGEVHGLSVGASGMAFISIQNWLEGSVGSTDKDWRGESLGPIHQKRLG